MFDYLNKFNNLSPDLRASVSSPQVVGIIEDLEKEFNIELASLIMRVMIKDVRADSLPLLFFTEFGLNQEKSEQLSEKLKNQVFKDVADYLGISLFASNNIKTEKDKEEKILKVDSKNNIINNNEDDQVEVIKLKKRIRLPLIEDSEEDIKEEDLSKNQEILNQYQKDEYRKKINTSALEIVEILNIKFKNDDIENKFLLLLDKYLRGIKDRFSVRQVFTENIDSGGFGLADKMVDNIFLIAEKIKDRQYSEIKKDLKIENDILKKIDKLSHGKISSESDYKFLPREDFAYELPVFESDKNNLPMVMEEKSVLTFDDIKKEVVGEKNSSRVNLDEKKFEKLKMEELARKEAVPLISKPIIKSQLSSSDGAKIKMTDIRKIKITGPVDEVRYMDLVNFRRLSDDPGESFNKIGQKLKVLEAIDYGKMIEGVKAWRQSPVNKTYLKIFSKASNEGLSIDQVIEDLKNSGQEYLTREEIDALIKFNKSLMF